MLRSVQCDEWMKCLRNLNEITYFAGQVPGAPEPDPGVPEGRTEVGCQHHTIWAIGKCLHHGHEVEHHLENGNMAVKGIGTNVSKYNVFTECRVAEF